MPKFMLVVSAKLMNIVLLQPRVGSDDTTINYFFKVKCEQCGWISNEEACVSLRVKENLTARIRRRNYNSASLMCEGCERKGLIKLIPGYESALSQHRHREVGLMLFDCDGLLPVKYSFNGEWLAITKSGKEVHPNLVSGQYSDYIEGEQIGVTNLEAKFVSYKG